MTTARRAARVACAMAGLGLLAWSGAALAQPTHLDPDMVARAEHPGGYPTFASIPPLPKDVRTPAAWKAAVVRTRLAGAHIQRLADNLPPPAADTEGWAADARAEASPPAAVTTHAEDDAALIAAMRARASAPSRPK